ncbi:MAG: enoyl-CoA hydratase/isomerase family protein [Chitinophagales bacterium]|nr:enoyl-CoA hydratase-related protein [Chitinophagales bacterium]MCZ2393495.1 enoyl-CoA hydratase/isomerase family protein [Chitinophagales bacterium]
MVFQNLLWSLDSGVLTITINRPDKLNALNSATILEIKDAFESASKLVGLKGIILTGSGDKAFVAGADISEFKGLDANQAKSLAQRGHDIFNLIENMHVPVIALVNGYALGGGCELAMACHMRIATSNAKFGQPEVNLGIIAGYGGTQRMIQYIGKARSLELHLTADTIDAEKALHWGLVNYIETDKGSAFEKALYFINKIGTKGPIAVAKVIKVTNDYFIDGVDGFSSEVDAFGDIFNSNDVTEGVNAFLEKRKANFKGK